jgi:hypothetical protein
LRDLAALLGSSNKLNQQEFNSSGTWVRPAGVGLIFVTAISGGGGGANTFFGLAGVACNKLPMTVTGNLSIVVGAGGAGSVVGGNGGDGVNTSIGGLVIPGGLGALNGSQPSRSAPNIYLSYPEYIIWNTSNTTFPMQKAAGAFVNFGGVGAVAANTGKGGQNQGVAGSSGYVLIEWFN